MICEKCCCPQHYWPIQQSLLHSKLLVRGCKQRANSTVFWRSYALHEAAPLEIRIKKKKPCKMDLIG